jgi:hypothetical protein
MSEFHVFDDRVEVAGAIVLAIGMSVRMLGGDASSLLRRHGVEHVKPGSWVKMQRVLDLLKDLQENGRNHLNLVQIGNMLPDFLPWPAQIRTVEQAFEVLPSQLQAAHRYGNAGFYKVLNSAPRQILATAHSPYPSDVDYGLCWGLLRRFAPVGSHAKVIHLKAPCRSRGDDDCVYEVSW